MTATVLDVLELDETALVLERALIDWIDRGATVAVIPVRLLGVDAAHALDVILDRLHLCGSRHDGALEDVARTGGGILHVCVAPAGHDDDCPWLDAHLWLDMQRDDFIEKHDPVARVAVRAGYAAGIIDCPFAHIAAPAHPDASLVDDDDR